LGVRRIPGPRLVRAFTLARMGQLSDARIELDHFLEEYQQGNETRANLSVALDQVRPR
jgi:hypothetical protein